MFDVAVDMVKQSSFLSKVIKIIPSTKRMVYQPTGSIYKKALSVETLQLYTVIVSDLMILLIQAGEDISKKFTTSDGAIIFLLMSRSST